jgi:hypothetical protein
MVWPISESVAGTVEHILGRRKESSQRSQVICVPALGTYRRSKNPRRRIDVENRASHYLSQTEIASAKRIYRHLSALPTIDRKHFSAQSPRRKEFTAHCPANYAADGNCYAPDDSAHKWFLDANVGFERRSFLGQTVGRRTGRPNPRNPHSLTHNSENDTSYAAEAAAARDFSCEPSGNQADQQPSNHSVAILKNKNL